MDVVRWRALLAFHLMHFKRLIDESGSDNLSQSLVCILSAHESVWVARDRWRKENDRQFCKRCRQFVANNDMVELDPRLAREQATVGVITAFEICTCE